MKVSHLSELLAHFGNGIESAGSAHIARELAQLSAAMAPFADRTVADFVQFLQQCEQYQRTGVVEAAPPAEPPPVILSNPELVASAAHDLKQLLDEARRKDVPQDRINQAVAVLEPLTKGDLDEVARQLDIHPKPRSKADAINKIRDTISMQAEISARVALSSEGF